MATQNFNDYPIFNRSARLRITREEEIELGRIIQADPDSANAVAARNRMVRGNIALVVATARSFFYLNRPLADRIQDGNLGLIRAAEKFDPEQGVRFSTYASWWIRQAIRRGKLADRNIYLPEHIHLLLLRINRAQDEIAQSQKPVTIEALAQHLNIKSERVRYLLGLKPHTRSFEEPVSGTLILADTISDERCWERHQEALALGQQALALLQKLPAHQREILEELYIKEQSHKAISTARSLSTGTIASRRNRGLNTLKSKIQL